MHMILRIILIFLKKPFMKPAGVYDTISCEMRVLPTDLDILWHVNNGMYFSYMDFGRWTMVFRNGIFDQCKSHGWYAVVASQTIKFKRSLLPWVKFRIETKTVAQDDKYFFIQQKFFAKGELMATGLVKVRFMKKKGGTVSPEEMLKTFNLPFENNGKDLGDQWFDLEKKYMS
jgi:acyl-CoA thioesterase FadM